MLTRHVALIKQMEHVISVLGTAWGRIRVAVKVSFSTQLHGRAGGRVGGLGQIVVVDENVAH